MDVSLEYEMLPLDGLIDQGDTDGFRIKFKQMDPPNTTHSEYLYFTDVKVDIYLERQVRKYIYQYYIPCYTIVMASSFSFIIRFSAVPARVALVVTMFLTLTNIFINQMVSINT